jgi:mannitol/fructose-specific phosphotransferase system IIA component (Ntr-type)
MLLSQTRETTSTCLAGYTSLALIAPAMQGCTQTAVLNELAGRLERAACVPDGPALVQAALARERICPTIMEAGLAMPHARIEGLPRLSFAVGRCVPPVCWGESGAPSAHLVFLLAAPAGDTKDYLRVLSGLAKLDARHPWLNRLLTAQDAPGIWAVLNAIHLRPGS